MSSWADAIDKASQNLGIGISQMVRAIALQIYSGVKQKTPVDLGHLRAAWNISIGSAIFIETPGQIGNGNIGTLPDYPIVHITNGLPYAVVVEYGAYPGVGLRTVAGSNPETGSGIFSKQAPAGMVEVTLADIKMNLQAVAGGSP